MARSTLNSRNAALSAKRSVTATRKAVIEAICKCMLDVWRENGGRLPYGYMKMYIEENRKEHNWITRDVLNSGFTRYKREMGVFQNSVVQVTSSVGSHASNGSMSSLSNSQHSAGRNKGGRPSGSTEESKRQKMDKIVSMKNDITAEYEKEKEKGKMKKNQLKEIIKKHKKKRDLEDVDVPQDTIRQRVSRKKPFVPHHNSGGHTSPLAKIDDTIVSIILMMARIRQCLSPSKGLALVNSLIENQPIQDELISWKKKYTCNDKGSVGPGYWRCFMKRNKHKIVSKRGQKYALDRQNWTTYANFLHMYQHSINEMVDAGVAKKLDAPKWMDRNGDECEESQALGCKVTHELCHPDLCFVGDEVGGNLSMKGDGHAGGQKFLTGTGTVPYRKTSSSDKRFTMIGLTALDGSPVMCVLIIMGKKRNLAVETGIDLTITPEGNEENHSFFLTTLDQESIFLAHQLVNLEGRKYLRWCDGTNRDLLQVRSLLKWCLLWIY